VKFYGWKLLAVMWLIVFTNFGFPLCGAAVINPYMAADLHFSRGTLGIVYAIFQLTTGVPGPLVAFFINKKGVRFTLIAGCVLVVLGSVMMALFVHTAVQVFIVFGLIVGLGAFTGGPLAAQTGIAQWFVNRRTFAISVLLTGGGISTIVGPPLLNRLIAASGGNWRVAWWSVMAGSIFAMLLAFFFVKERPADLGQLPDGRRADEEPVSAAAPARARRTVYHCREDWRLSQVWHSRTFWLMLVALFGFSPGYAALMAHGVVHLEDLGNTPAQAAFFISLTAAAGLLGMLAVAGLGDRIELRLIWAVASLAFGVGMLLMLKATQPAVFWSSAILLGAGFAACITCVMTLPANYFGHKAYASVVGVLMVAGTISAAVGAYGAGYVYDHFGSYRPAFYAIAVLCLISFFILIVLKPPVRKEEPALTV
jgi:MFS family permease